MFFMFRRLFSGYIMFSLLRAVFSLLSSILPQWASVTVMLLIAQWGIAEIFGMGSILGFSIHLMQAIF